MQQAGGIVTTGTIVNKGEAHYVFTMDRCRAWVACWIAQGRARQPNFMYFLKRYRFVFAFMALLVFCSVMVVKETLARRGRHLEMREAFILLHSRGYTNEAQHLFHRLLKEIPKLSNKDLMDDFQRTVILVDPTIKQTGNPLYDYHWTVSNELDKRSEDTLVRARKMAEEEK